MSQRPINLSPDLKKLRDDGYDLETRSGYLLVRDVPYVNSRREVVRGILVMKLDLADDVTVRPPDHTAFFGGDYPRNEDGTEIAKIKHSSQRQSLVDGVVVDHLFSAKPKPADVYPDYYVKVKTYVSIISGPAWRINGATAQTYPFIPEEEESEGPFRYIDTAASRAEIVTVTQKLALGAVGIFRVWRTGTCVF